MSHTATPWKVQVHDDHTAIESELFTVTSDVNNEDAERIVACVNACAGLEPKEIPGLLKSVIHLLATMPLFQDSIATDHAVTDVVRYLKRMNAL